MGELILIYRCWVLWSKNYWVILIPTLAAIGNLGNFYSPFNLNPAIIDYIWLQYVAVKILTFC